MKRKPLQIDVVTLFPTFFNSPLQESIVKIAQNKKFVTIAIHNLRDYTYDLHRTCDDKPFGGGPGMVMKPEPIFECIENIKKKHPKRRVIYLTPQGKPLHQKKLEELSRLSGFILLCGHYEGVDQRIRDHLVDEEISIGDFVLTGGEIPALCLIDGIIRLIPGVLGNKESLKHERKWSVRIEHIALETVAVEQRIIMEMCQPIVSSYSDKLKRSNCFESASHLKIGLRF